MQKRRQVLEEKTTKSWKIIYGLATLKLGQEDPFKDIGQGEAEEQGKKGEKEEEEEAIKIENIEEKKTIEKVEEAPRAK